MRRSLFIALCVRIGVGVLVACVLALVHAPVWLTLVTALLITVAVTLACIAQVRRWSNCSMDWRSVACRGPPEIRMGHRL